MLQLILYSISEYRTLEYWRDGSCHVFLQHTKPLLGLYVTKKVHIPPRLGSTCKQRVRHTWTHGHTEIEILIVRMVSWMDRRGLFLWRERPHKREDHNRQWRREDLLLEDRCLSAVFQGRGRGRGRTRERRTRTILEDGISCSRIILLCQLSRTTHHVRIFRGRFLCPRSTVVNRERMRTKTTTTTTTTQDTRDWNCIACRRGESNFS